MSVIQTVQRGTNLPFGKSARVNIQARLTISCTAFSGILQRDEVYSKLFVVLLTPQLMSISATRSAIQSSDLRQKRRAPTPIQISASTRLRMIQAMAYASSESPDC